LYGFCKVLRSRVANPTGRSRFRFRFRFRLAGLRAFRCCSSRKAAAPLARSVEPHREQGQPLGACRGVEAAVPSREGESLPGKHESGGEVEGVEAPKIVLQGERGGVLRERLIDLDDAERGPLVVELGARRCRTSTSLRTPRSPTGRS